MSNDRTDKTLEQAVNAGEVPSFKTFHRLATSAVAKKYGHPIEKVEMYLGMALRGKEPVARTFLVKENGAESLVRVTREGVGILERSSSKNPGHHEFWHYTFNLDDKWGPYHVLWHGDIDPETLLPKPKDQGRLLIRTDSGCLTGQVFHDRTCDCREQLHLAMEEIGANGEGLIVHIPRQDGRGMGLAWKQATLILQKFLGVDTVESARMLIPNETGIIDARTYAGVLAICQFLGFGPGALINLATNNERKLRVFQENGYNVTSTPVHVPATEHTARHYAAKNTELGHTLPSTDDEK